MYEQRIQGLVFDVENLREKICILENFEGKVSRVAGLEKEVEELRGRCRELENQNRSILQVHEEIEGELLKAMEESETEAEGEG